LVIYFSNEQELLFKSINNALAQMSKIWMRMGVGKASQEERSAAVLKHVQVNWHATDMVG